MEETKNAEEIKQTADGNLEQGDFKVKKRKPKKLSKKAEPVKLDLTKKEEKDAVPESRTGDVDETQPTTPVSEVVEEVREVPQAETPEKEEVKKEVKTEESPIEEVTEIQEKVENTPQAIKKEEIKETPKVELPENVEKLVNFMKETGGNIEDYVKLNKDYSDLENEDLLVEYYSQTKPHLNHDEISFLLDDQFAWDEDIDEERVVRKKKLALKEEIAKAKNFLETSKSKYYDEIKLRPGVTQEQQKAMDFFNRYKTEQEAKKQEHESFKTNTNKFFTNEFKGFDFKLGEKQFRYKVNNASDVANVQSDLNNFIGKFLDKDGKINDLEGYHKALYAARNADTIASHFYEQGKTDAIKNQNARSKNITNEVRPTAANGELYINGLKVKAISGVDSSKLKVKTRK